MPRLTQEMKKLVREEYDASRIHIAVVASHSALDVLYGVKKAGFRTIAVAERRRLEPYRRLVGRVIDELIVLERYADMVREEVQERLRRLNAIIVPNRSFAVYVGYDAIEEELRIPIYGNRYLLRWEERTGDKTYYRLLDEAGIPRPRVYRSIDEVDRPVMVKLPEAARRVERAFFVARDAEDLRRRLEELREKGIIDEESLKEMSIEEFVDGAHFNINFFYSVVRGELELYSIDRRLQTNIDDINRWPAWIQERLEGVVTERLIEIGHIPVTIRESMLNRIFPLAEKLLEAAKRLEPPGIIGPFTLQLIVRPDLKPVVYDLALRVGGGTNSVMAWGGQYIHLWLGRPVTLGERIGIEVREAIEAGRLEDIVT